MGFAGPHTFGVPAGCGRAVFNKSAFLLEKVMSMIAQNALKCTFDPIF